MTENKNVKQDGFKFGDFTFVLKKEEKEIEKKLIIFQKSWFQFNTETKSPRIDLSQFIFIFTTSPEWAFTCSKLTIETLEQVVKYVQS